MGQRRLLQLQMRGGGTVCAQLLWLLLFSVQTATRALSIAVALDTCCTAVAHGAAIAGVAADDMLRAYVPDMLGDLTCAVAAASAGAGAAVLWRAADGAHPQGPNHPGCTHPEGQVQQQVRSGDLAVVGLLIWLLRNRTVWHRAVATIFTRTSPGPGGSTDTMHTSSGCLASQAMAALHSMGLPAVAANSAMARGGM